MKYMIYNIISLKCGAFVIPIESVSVRGGPICAPNDVGRCSLRRPTQARRDSSPLLWDDTHQIVSYTKPSMMSVPPNQIQQQSTSIIETWPAICGNEKSFQLRWSVLVQLLGQNCLTSVVSRLASLFSFIYEELLILVAHVFNQVVCQHLFHMPYACAHWVFWMLEFDKLN